MQVRCERCHAPPFTSSSARRGQKLHRGRPHVSTCAEWTASQQRGSSVLGLRAQPVLERPRQWASWFPPAHRGVRCRRLTGVWWSGEADAPLALVLLSRKSSGLLLRKSSVCVVGLAGLRRLHGDGARAEVRQRVLAVPIGLRIAASVRPAPDLGSHVTNRRIYSPSRVTRRSG